MTISNGAVRCNPLPVLVALVVLAAASVVAPAAANDPGSGWMRFASQSHQDVYGGPPVREDRSFVREWEVNPPKGFPTLAAENVAATKAAISVSVIR